MLYHFKPPDLLLPVGGSSLRSHLCLLSTVPSGEHGKILCGPITIVHPGFEHIALQVVLLWPFAPLIPNTVFSWLTSVQDETILSPPWKQHLHTKLC